jgi:hypothetical protein
MPKYLIEVNYVGEGVSGLLKEGGTRRRAAVDELFKSMGGHWKLFISPSAIRTFSSLAIFQTMPPPPHSCSG